MKNKRTTSLQEAIVFRLFHMLCFLLVRFYLCYGFLAHGEAIFSLYAFASQNILVRMRLMCFIHFFLIEHLRKGGIHWVCEKKIIMWQRNTRAWSTYCNIVEIYITYAQIRAKHTQRNGTNTKIYCRNQLISFNQIFIAPSTVMQKHNFDGLKKNVKALFCWVSCNR